MLFGSEKNPKGPSWSNLRDIEKCISGTQIQFSTPPLRLPLQGRTDLEMQPDRFDLDDTAIYKTCDRSGTDTGLLDARIWLSGWNFTGRPFLDSDSVGDLVFRLSVLKLEDLPVNQSLFNHSALNDLVRRFHVCTEIGGDHKGHAEDRSPFDLTQYRWPNYLSPINSQWLNRNGNEWLYFESQPLWNGAQEFYWLSPIGHQYCVMGHYMVTHWLRNAGNSYRQVERSSTDAYRQLMLRIMDTMSIELSSDAEAERKSVYNPSEPFYLPSCSERLVEQAKHTLYMWSGKGYTDKSQPKQGGDHRAPKEDVAAFIDQRIKPRPLPGCLAIGPAFVADAEADNRKPEITTLSDKPAIGGQF